MTAEAIRVVHYHRKLAKDAFSLERIFTDVRGCLSSRVSFSVFRSRFESRGVWPRVYNVIDAAFRQGDINHITGDVHFLTLLLDKNKTILTIADCVSLERLRGLKWFVVWLFWYWLPIRRCRAVTVISESTKVELLRYVKIDPASVVVIYPSVSDIFQPSLSDFHRECPRILQIGITPNKNIERVAKALEGIPCRLVVIGKMSDSQEKSLRKSRIQWETHLKLTDAELLEQYRKSDILIFASTYEGFGLPIVEAQAIGRPVITSNCYSMPEVAGNAACIVDPYDSDSIKNGVLRVIQDDEYRRALVEAGFKNVIRFRPAKVAKDYFELYRRVHAELSHRHTRIGR